MTKADVHKWEFKARFRRHAFGWRSQPAITRIRQAVTEIKRVERKDPVLAAEGAVTFLERVSPALEHVDSSSGSIGTAVGNAITALVPVIANAPADAKTREAWLERLFDAHERDHIPYIERLADHWDKLCASKEVASAWADRLLGITQMALSPDKNLRGHYHGTAACLSALFRAERFDELIALLDVDVLWHYRRWAAKALAARGRTDEAVTFAESCRSPWASDHDIDCVCEAALLAAGRVEDAYVRYGTSANVGTTYLATFRAVSKRYPHKTPRELLMDLVKGTPGDEGKWFAAAKEAGFLDEALALAARSPCDPKPLTRAARDHAESHPAFAVEAGLLALHWLVLGHGYEITGAGVLDAYHSTMAAAERIGTASAVRERVRALVASERGDGFVTKVLGATSGADPSADSMRERGPTHQLRGPTRCAPRREDVNAPAPQRRGRLR